jgi:hypothetical protein
MDIIESMFYVAIHAKPINTIATMANMEAIKNG